VKFLESFVVYFSSAKVTKGYTKSHKGFHYEVKAPVSHEFMKTDIRVCFLRGINVSGRNLIKMADLTKLFRELGFTDVKTYLQSGNVIFSFNEDLKEAEMKSLIITGIKKKFCLDISVIFRTREEINNILKGNSFLNNENADTGKLYVTFLETYPDTDRAENLKKSDFSFERFCLSGREVFLFMPEGYGRAKLNNNSLEKKLGCTATTRNWKTISAIAGIMGRI
jgi:uncharacterized protein (DUF1697 family)